VSYFKLLTISNTKTLKGFVAGYVTAILHLAPSRLSGFNVCPGASLGCISGCLNSAGRGRFTRTQDARIRKTRYFFSDREAFMLDLVNDIKALVRRCAKIGATPCVRLNGTSDVRWENVPVAGYENIFAMFPDVQFYDYTKLANRRNIPANYHLTYSRSEENDSTLGEAISNGMNVAVVFSSKSLPVVWRGLPVVNGDINDLRFLDPRGVIVGLVAKGKAKTDTSGFVIAA
jgi:hypothetical protein